MSMEPKIQLTESEQLTLAAFALRIVSSTRTAMLRARSADRMVCLSTADALQWTESLLQPTTYKNQLHIAGMYDYGNQYAYIDDPDNIAPAQRELLDKVLAVYRPDIEALEKQRDEENRKEG